MESCCFNNTELYWLKFCIELSVCFREYQVRNGVMTTFRYGHTNVKKKDGFQGEFFVEALREKCRHTFNSSASSRNSDWVRGIKVEKQPVFTSHFRPKYANFWWEFLQVGEVPFWQSDIYFLRPNVTQDLSQQKSKKSRLTSRCSKNANANALKGGTV